MDNHNCTIKYYDWNGDWIESDCTEDLADPDMWYNVYSASDVWANTTISEEMPWIWSYW